MRGYDHDRIRPGIDQPLRGVLISIRYILYFPFFSLSDIGHDDRRMRHDHGICDQIHNNASFFSL